MVNEVANVAITREALDQLVATHGTIAFITSGCQNLKIHPLAPRNTTKVKENGRIFCRSFKKVGDQVKIFSLIPGWSIRKCNKKLLNAAGRKLLNDQDLRVTTIYFFRPNWLVRPLPISSLKTRLRPRNQSIRQRNRHRLGC